MCCPTSSLRLLCHPTQLKYVRVEFAMFASQGSDDLLHQNLRPAMMRTQFIKQLEIMEYMPQVLMDNLSSFHDLQRLEFGTGFADQLRLPRLPPLAQLLLPSLHTVVVWTTGIDNLSTFFGYIRCPLHHLQISAGDAGVLAPLVRELARNYSHTLRVLRISVHTSAAVADDRSSEGLISAIRGLKLSELDLRFWGNHHFNDAFAMGLAAQLPMLDKLRIGGLVVQHFDKLITFTGLFGLLKGCVKLQYLKLIFDASTPLPLETAPVSLLEELDVDSSRTGEPTEVARVFAQMFPKLRGFEYANDAFKLI
jgi:hypothetical protein